MARKKLTEAELAAQQAEKEAIKAARLAEEERIHKKKTFHDELWAILILVLGVFLALALFTTTTGVVGDTVERGLNFVLGSASFVLPFFLIVYGVLVFAKRTAYLSYRTLTCIVFFVLLSALAVTATKHNGGIVGSWLGAIVGLLGTAGTWIVIVVGFLITLLFLFDTPLSAVFDNMKVRREARKKTREEEEQIAMQFQAQREAEAAAKAEEEARLAEEQAKLAEEQAKATEIEQIQHPLVTGTEEPKPEIKTNKNGTPILNLAALVHFQKDNNIQPPAEEPAKTIIDYDDPPVTQIREELPTYEEAKADFDELVAEIPEAEAPKEPEIPFYEEGDYTENQKRILGLVTDDTIFGTKPEPKTDVTEIVFETPMELAEKAEEAAEEPVEEPQEELHIDFTPAKVSISDVQAVSGEVLSDIKKSEAKPIPKYKFPPMDLLKKANKKSNGGDDLNELASTLETTMQSFGVNAKVIDITRGPAVTRFEVQPAVGVKVSSITKLHDDLALNLRAKSLRIEAPIPGKAAVGIEISNSEISTVTLREIVESKEFKDHKSKTAVAIGRSINGDAIVANLHNMPHLLIAGSTGSGKSVCINTMLVSMMYKATPQQLKLILIDPKVVELSVYNGIPHLLIPVVTDPAKASAALGWAVAEMNERYNKFAEVEVRDLASYNEYVVANDEPDKVMPEVVIIIDELNDLIMAAKSTVEDSICRLAQKARAAGMHLVVATQRPSVDVITGVIKANIPSRIAFAVSNMMDSRTILDEGGAEHLLGKGDMLYAPSGSPKPLRVQGCFVSDEEVKSVIDFVKKTNNENEYNSDVIHAISKVGSGAAAGKDDDEDELLKDAIECVVRAGGCSVSMLQRRFRIGYNRSARIVELMEERGIVGPADGSKQRKVNMTIEEFEAMENSNPDVPDEIL